MARASNASPAKSVELRSGLEALAQALRAALGAAGVPVLDEHATSLWSAVVPLSTALHHATKIIETAPRSARQLDEARTRLLSAAALVYGADGPAEERTRYGTAHLAVAVPGPDGHLVGGIFEVRLDGLHRIITWAPDVEMSVGQDLTRVAGRPKDFSYRWGVREVWEQLAHDMIVVSCGWRSFPDRLPPSLRRRGAGALGVQLSVDLGGASHWALSSETIVRWLVHQREVTVMPFAAVDSHD